MGKLGELLSHPDELVPLLSMYLAARRTKVLPKNPSLAFCYDMLNRVSRSFAVVIQQLPPQLRDAICVFYLVLRALDTVEDDMALPQEEKVPLLRCFHEKCYDRGWHMECGTGEYCRLMEQYPLVTDAFLGLDKQMQGVIADICKRMGNGMADFVPREVATTEQYNLYCHYVAGLVGVGLSQLFAASGLESREFFTMEAEANQMGLFLQKTNIIRDYLEDITEEPAPRMFWPREIWGIYAQELVEFKDPDASVAALGALNDMILNALSHIQTCLAYMSMLRNRAVLRFCAIPQIMAMATLELCYNNHKVFTGVVKMRRGEVAKVMYYLEDYADVLILFRKYAAALAAKATAARQEVEEEEGDAVAEGEVDVRDTALAERMAYVHGQVIETCGRVVATCSTSLAEWEAQQVATYRAREEAPVDLGGRFGIMVLAVGYATYAWHIDKFRAYLGVPGHGANPGLDSINRALAALLMVYALYVALTGKRV